MSRIITAVAALAFIGTGAHAQIIRAPGGDPKFTITPSVGFLNLQDISDGSSQTQWDFGSALVYRVAIERRVFDQLAAGVLLSYSSLPLRYFATSSTPMQPTCTQGLSCNASVNQTTVAAHVSSGGSYGVHQIFNFAIGMTMYDGFRENSTGRQLAPLYVDRDFFLSIGLGLGIGLSRRFSINIVQDYGLIVHQRGGLQGNASSNSRTYQTRVGTRIGVGG